MNAEQLYFRALRVLHGAVTRKPKSFDAALKYVYFTWLELRKRGATAYARRLCELEDMYFGLNLQLREHEALIHWKEQ